MLLFVILARESRLLDRLRRESEWSWALLPRLENKTPPRDCLEFTTENFERIVLPPALRGWSKDEWLLDNRTSKHTSAAVVSFMVTRSDHCWKSLLAVRSVHVCVCVCVYIYIYIYLQFCSTFQMQIGQFSRQSDVITGSLNPSERGAQIEHNRTLSARRST